MSTSEQIESAIHILEEASRSATSDAIRADINEIIDALTEINVEISLVEEDSAVI